jgi:predicted RNA-binding protein YlxR (DUF448 family)
VSKRGHVSMRTCLGCGARDPQRALWRIVRDDGGGLRPDVERRLGGRGGYLHPRPDCWGRFARRKGLVRSLRASVDRPARAALVAQLGSVLVSEG